jgi:DNA-binding transcriptional ArsR family regulator
MKEVEVIGALSALAHPVRLKVFRALVVSGPQGLTPGVMQSGLGVPAATLSFHLKELSASGLVSQERASRNLVYRAEMAHMNDVLGYLTRNCSGDNARPAAGQDSARVSAAAARR